MAINLDKITLEKQGDSHRIDLTKRSAGSSEEIVVNLNWSKGGTVKKGFFASLFGGNTDIDLDLGCYWELKDGSRSVIDGVQFAHHQGGPRNRLTRQGRYTEPPWIWHTGDDRSGSASEGENILVNPNGIKDLQRILVYCFIYEGVARWSETNAIVTIKVPGNPSVVVEMGAQSDARKFCAIADITFDSTGCMTVRKLVSFHNDHSACDRSYGWGMQWHAGGK